MPSEARARLAEQQAALLTALAGRAAPPADFDAERVRACAEALLRKRARAAARAWPVLERSLGEVAFRDRFLTYARTAPLPSDGGPLADGLGFARQLLRMKELSDEARLELLRVELWRRRGPILRCAWLRQGRRLVLALKLPWLGVWSFAIG